MIADPSDHETDGSEFNEGESGSREIFKILCEPAAAAQPCECALDDPAARQNLEPRGVIGAFDNFDLEPRQRSGKGLPELRPLVAAIGEEFFQKREQAEYRRQNEDAAVAILDIGWMNNNVQQQPKCIYENMPLLTLDLLSGIVADPVDRAPPFSALFTL